MAGGIAAYFAKLSIDVDQSSLKRVDSLLGSIEKRLGKFAQFSGKELDDSNKKQQNSLDRTAKQAQKTHDHQMNLMRRYNKEQQALQAQSAKIAQNVHDHQMKLMNEWGKKQKETYAKTAAYATKSQISTSQKMFRDAATARLSYLQPLANKATTATQQKMYNDLFGATTKNIPKSLTSSQIAKNQQSFFAASRQIELKSGYGSQYRRGEQARTRELEIDKKINSMLKDQAALLERIDKQRAKVKPTDYASTFSALQTRLAGATRAYTPLSQRTIKANQASFFASARASDLRTGQGSQYRLGEQAQQQLLALRLAHIKMFQDQVRASAEAQKQRLRNERETNRKIEQERKKSNKKQLSDSVSSRREDARDRASSDHRRDVLERGRAQDRRRSTALEERRRIQQDRRGRYGSLGPVEAFGRFGVMGLPMAGGIIAAGMGISQLNRSIQEYESQNLALEAVAGDDKAQQYKDYLNNLGTKLGMTTSSLMPSFTQYLASAQGTPLESNIQPGFEAFTQYGAVMGLDPQSMKGSLRALTQMVSKQKIYAEELQGQLAEQMPAAVRLMAEAVTGGDTAALRDMMARGELNPNEVLPKFFEVLRTKSQGKLGDYYKTTRFAQGSFQKSVEDLMKLFAQSGGSSGFTRFFNALNEGAKSSIPIVRGLSESFEQLSIAFEAPVSLFGELNKGLEELSKVSGVSEGSLTTLAGVGLLLTTRFGAVGVALTGVAVGLQDVIYGLKGYDSITKRIMDENPGEVGKFPVTDPNSLSYNRPNDFVSNQIGKQRDIYLESIRQEERDRFKRLHGDQGINGVLGELSSRFSSLGTGFGNVFTSEEEFAAMNEQRRKLGLSVLQTPPKSTNNEYNFGGVQITIPESQVPDGMAPMDFGEMIAREFTKKIQEAQNAIANP